MGLRIPHFLGVISTIASTEYLAIVPERCARIIANDNQIKVMEPPFGVPQYRVMQHWHELYAKDPAVT